MGDKPPLPIFDALCRISENHYRALLPALRRARLFKFPGRPHEILPKRFERNEIELMQSHFFLPFDYVAVEDPATCIVLWDSEPNAEGWQVERFFAECVPIYCDPDDFGPGKQDDVIEIIKLVQESGITGKPYVVTVGQIKGTEQFDETGFKVFGRVDVAFLATERRMCAKQPTLMTSDKEAAIRNITVALNEIAYFNSPDRFILERRQRKRSKVRNGKVARSFNRSMFTMMTPREIRQKLNLGDDTLSTGTKVPHSRRRHYRTYRSERYREMRGKTVVIPATWIGPHRTTVDGHDYEVRLDL